MTRRVLRVLIIDDEAVLAKNIATYLDRHGYEVSIASSAEAGLSKLNAFRPDVIFLDFNMPPGMNGLEALTEIRAIDPHVKVMMMSADGGPDIAVKAIRGGAFLFVTKPISLVGLKQMLEEVVLDDSPG